MQYTHLHTYRQCCIIVLEVYLMGTARTRANNKYNAKAYDRIPVQVKKGMRDTIKAFANAKNMTVNEYIKSLIAADIGGIEL